MRICGTGLLASPFLTVTGCRKHPSPAFVEPTGAPYEGTDDQLLDEIRGIHAGGGFGSIIGRNSFQRAKGDAIALMHRIMDIYAGP